MEAVSLPSRSREVWIDWMRIAACFMVMVVHSTEPFYLGGEGSQILTRADASSEQIAKIRKGDQNDWMTSLEDGFLTLHYSTWWGTQPRRHELMLILGTNPDDPYEVLLEHRANGDPKAMEADALVTFDINDRLPASQDPGNTPLVTLKWRNDAGETNRRQFSFCRRD